MHTPFIFRRFGTPLGGNKQLFNSAVQDSVALFHGQDLTYWTSVSCETDHACLQFDVHQPFTTVHEALRFSAHLRFDTKTSTDTVEQFVLEVMKLVELDSLANALVGRPGISGLSVEQRKRLTISVELVANPSVVFMDEPTSGTPREAPDKPLTQSHVCLMSFMTRI